jgi:hypothetical protein
MKDHLFFDPGFMHNARVASIQNTLDIEAAVEEDNQARRVAAASIKVATDYFMRGQLNADQYAENAMMEGMKLAHIQWAWRERQRLWFEAREKGKP